MLYARESSLNAAPPDSSLFKAHQHLIRNWPKLISSESKTKLLSCWAVQLDIIQRRGEKLHLCVTIACVSLSFRCVHDFISWKIRFKQFPSSIDGRSRMLRPFSASTSQTFFSGTSGVWLNSQSHISLECVDLTIGRMTYRGRAVTKGSVWIFSSWCEFTGC